MFKSSHTADIMAAALEISVDDVTQDLALGASAAWTSLSHMRLILALEDLLDRRLEPNEIVSLISAAQVDGLLSANN